MIPQSQPRKKRNSSKVNLFISFVFHAALVLTLLYFAARQGLLGKQLKKISIEMVKEKPKEKPKEPEKPKVEPPKVQQPKIETPKIAEAPKVPAVAAPPTVAPAAAELPSFEFDGGKAVLSSSDPVQLYKSALEFAFRSKWNRPDNLSDDNYAAEVQVEIARDGKITGSQWQNGSGNPRWDDSVRAAIAAVNRMDRPPPTNFPSSVTIRFDVQQETEPVLQ